MNYPIQGSLERIFIAWIRAVYLTATPEKRKQMEAVDSEGILKDIEQP